MTTTTIGVFRNRIDAEGVINELRNLGVSDERISFIYQNNEGETETREGSGEHVAKETGSGAATGVGTGAALGALAGVAVAAGILPGLGALFIGGQLATALGLTGGAATTAAGAMTGAVAGGLIGALSGLGIGATEAATYQKHVEEGNILVVVDGYNEGLKDVFGKFNAEEVREYTQAA
jgi:hypothetical protein